MNRVGGGTVPALYALTYDATLATEKSCKTVTETLTVIFNGILFVKASQTVSLDLLRHADFCISKRKIINV